MQHIGALLVFLALVFAAGGFGAQFTPGEWYAALRKPPGTPPNAVFGPVWTVLYLAIAVAAWWIWRVRHEREAARPALALWGTQLALNALWSYLFFGLHWMGVALLEIAVLGVLVAWTARRFHALVPSAGLLLLPYLAWVGYASYLNAGLWWLNR
ncbi:MAG: TspO/MBR family protein [Myxococcota bacterium]